MARSPLPLVDRPAGRRDPAGSARADSHDHHECLCSPGLRRLRLPPSRPEREGGKRPGKAFPIPPREPGRPARGFDLQAIKPSQPSAITGVPAASRRWMDSCRRARAPRPHQPYPQPGWLRCRRCWQGAVRVPAGFPSEQASRQRVRSRAGGITRRPHQPLSEPCAGGLLCGQELVRGQSLPLETPPASSPSPVSP